MVVVLSAVGASLPRVGLIPTLGGGGFAGNRYHQVVDAASGQPVGTQVALGFSLSDPAICWSPGGEVVVYADRAFRDVAVVVVRR
jgi:hypothetical protein